MVKDNKIRIAAIHVTAWICFILYEVLVAVFMGSKAGLWDFAAFYILDISLFYFNAAFVFNYASNLKRIALVLIPLVLIEITVFSILSLGIGLFLYKSQTGWSYTRIVKDDLVRAAWRGIFIIGLSTGYWLFMRTLAITKEANRLRILKLEAERSKADMEKNLVIAQNAFLQSQINPHFLFNTLNYIYNSVEKISSSAADSILLLSDIMRYALNETEQDGMVLLSEEVENIERYVKLTQLRFSNELFVSLDISIAENCKHCRVLPLLLLTFVENAFKHGDLTNSDKPARIAIKCEHEVLYLTTDNIKRASVIPSGRHTGIKNARTRLTLHYPAERFDLLLTNTSERFIVDLMIRL